jgi:hypothetical protein
VIKNGRKLTTIAAGGVRWCILPECRDFFATLNGYDMHDWLRRQQASTVKESPERTVYRISASGLSCYVKHFRVANLRAWLRELVRPAKARLEFGRALAVVEREIPAIVPLAFGERKTGFWPSESFLFTRALDESEPLDRFVEKTLAGFGALEQTRIRLEIASSLARCLARMHMAGIRHADLHPANLLIRMEDGTPRIYLVDLHAVSVGRRLSWREARRSLVTINHWFRFRASRSDRLRFWNAYCDCMNWQNAGRRKELAKELEQRTWRSCLEFWQRRDRRCQFSNRHYRTLKSPGIAGLAVRGVDPGALDSLLADPDRPFRDPRFKKLKDGPGSTVIEMELPVDGVRRTVIYKRHRADGWRDFLAGLFRKPPGLRSWIFGQGFLERWLPTARPLAVFERRLGRQLGTEYLITEKLPGAVDLHVFLERLRSQTKDDARQELRRRISQVAVLVREMHRRQISDRDLKAPNVLLSEDKAWLIDLVGVSFCRRLSRGRRLQNLARLSASFWNDSRLRRTDKVRFLRDYLQWGLHGKEGWKAWWHAIEARTRVKVDRNLRTDRPLA